MTIHQPRLEAFELLDNLILMTTGGKALAHYGQLHNQKATLQRQVEEIPRAEETLQTLSLMHWKVQRFHQTNGKPPI